MGFTDHAFDARGKVAVRRGGEDIEPAVVVKIPGPASEALDRPVDLHLRRDFREPAVPLVVIQSSGVFQVVDEQVREAVVIIVKPGATLGPPRWLAFNSCRGRDIIEAAVATVAIKAILLVFAGDEEIDPAVVVKIAPRSRVGIDGIEQAGFPGHIGEPAGAVVAQQCGTNRVVEPGPAGDEDIEPAVVVKIGLITHEPAELVRDPRLRRSVLECAVAAVAIECHRLGRIMAGDDDVQQSVTVEVVHDCPAGLVESIKARPRD